MSKILTAILLVISFIIVAELAIVYDRSHYKPQVNTSAPVPTAVPKSPPLPTIAPQMTVKEIADTWNYVWMKGLTDTVYFTTTNRGKISELEYTPDRKKTFSHEAQLDFSLNSLTEAKSSYHFYYKAQEVDKLTVFALVDGQKKKISVADLKNGDTVTLDVTANIFPEQGGQIKSMTITKE